MKSVLHPTTQTYYTILKSEDLSYFHPSFLSLSLSSPYVVFLK